MDNAHIPLQYLQVSQTAGALYHRARAYNEAVKSLASGASVYRTHSLQQEQDRLWLAYSGVRKLFDQHFPSGKTLPNRETVELRQNCVSLLAQSRAILLRRIGSATAAPSSNGPATQVAKTRPSPASHGATSSTRRTERRPLPEAEALLEALDELDPTQSPPSDMNSVNRPGSAGRYTFVAPEPDLTGAGRYSFVIPRKTNTIKVAASPGPKPELMLREPINSASRVLRNRMRYVDAVRQAGGGTRRVVNGEAESGWDIALRRTTGTRQPAPRHASATRKRIRAAAAPAFAAALDRAVDANLLRQFAAGHAGGVDAAKLRAAYAETANRTFAAEFMRLVGGQPPASAEDIALGAIIAVAIAQTTARFPIVPPAAVAPMAVLVHRALRPRLAELARMAAVITAPPPAPRAAASASAHETAW